MKDLLATAPVLHADETTGRAAGALAYVHVACTEYLTLMHVGDRAAKTSTTAACSRNSPGCWSATATPATPTCPPCTPGAERICCATCGRSPTPTRTASCGPSRWPTPSPPRTRPPARPANEGATASTPHTLATLINHYLGALAKGRTDNRGRTGELAAKARTLIRRFRRYQDMILRFATDLSVPLTNNQAERDVRPVKIQQRTSGGCWRTLQGLTEFAIVHSYLATATQMGHRQTRRPHRTLHHRRLATPSPRPQLNSYQLSHISGAQAVAKSGSHNSTRIKSHGLMN